MTQVENILVIKHGALGDIIMATGAFAAIRAQHPDAHIVLLTTKPFAELLAQSPYFNEIWIDSKPRLHDRKAITRLRAMLHSKRFTWMYDLQLSRRTSLYPWLLPRPWPKISGRGRFLSHPRPPHDFNKHILANLRAQLARAGIAQVSDPALEWLHEVLPPGLWSQTSPYAVLVPGCAPHRLVKRWPGEYYASLAAELASRSLTPLLVGTQAEAELLASVAARVPQAVNLGGKTSLAQLATLGRGAALAVGNDTGPMHLLAATGCPTLTLFSAASNPVRSAPIGPFASTLCMPDLRELGVDRVLVALPVPRLTEPGQRVG